MARLTNETMATAFQITVIVFIFSYTTPAVAKKVIESNKNIQTKEIHQPVNAVATHLQDKVYISKTVQPSGNNPSNNPSWILPEKKMEPNQVPAITTYQIVTPSLINYSATKAMFR